MADRQGVADEIALHDITPLGLQKGMLGFSLYAFGNGFESQAAGEGNHGRDNSRSIVTGCDILDKRLVYFQRAHWEALEVAEGRIAGPKVVNGEVDAHTPDG